MVSIRDKPITRDRLYNQLNNSRRKLGTHEPLPVLQRINDRLGWLGIGTIYDARDKVRGYYVKRDLPTDMTVVYCDVTIMFHIESIQSFIDRRPKAVAREGRYKIRLG